VNLKQLFSCFQFCNALLELGYRSYKFKVWSFRVQSFGVLSSKFGVRNSGFGVQSFGFSSKHHECITHNSQLKTPEPAPTGLVTDLEIRANGWKLFA